MSGWGMEIESVEDATHILKRLARANASLMASQLDTPHVLQQGPASPTNTHASHAAPQTHTPPVPSPNHSPAPQEKVPRTELEGQLKSAIVAGLFLAFKEMGDQSACTDLEDEIRRLRNENEALQLRIDTLGQKDVQWREHVTRIEDERDLLQTMVDKLQSKLETQRASQESQTRLQTRIQDLLQEVDAYREEIQKKELEERHIKERWSEQMLTHENVSSEESFRMLAQESEEVYRENVQLRQENDILKNRLANSDAYKELVDQYESDVANLNQELDERELELVRAKKILLSIRTRSKSKGLSRRKSGSASGGGRDRSGPGSSQSMSAHGSLRSPEPGDGAEGGRDLLPDLESVESGSELELAEAIRHMSPQVAGDMDSGEAGEATEDEESPCSDIVSAIEEELEEIDEELQKFVLSDDELLLSSPEAQEVFEQILNIWQRATEADVKYLNPRNRHLSPVQLLELGTNLLVDVQKDANELAVVAGRRGGVWAIFCKMLKEVVDLRLSMAEHTAFTIRQTEEKEKEWLRMFEQTALPPVKR